MRNNTLARFLLLGTLSAAIACASSCLSDEPTVLAVTEEGSGPVVKFDVFHKPFPEIPLPNDFATRFDPKSPTKLRLNASIMAGPTRWEQATRAELDKVSGWGTLAPITVSFDAPLDTEEIIARHWRDNYEYSDDVVLVLNVTPDSPGFCEAVPLDMGQGNYPQVLPEQRLFDSDNRAESQTAVFEEAEEDVNQNGVLDPGEDTDMDGVLDHPNTRDGMPGSEVLEFYERETNTLIMKPVMPMREETTYAVVLTKRLVSPDGAPVRSPFPGINHAGQTEALAPLDECLADFGLAVDDVAFTWSFTTQSISHDYKRVRDGLYGLGPMAHLATDWPAELDLDELRDATGLAINTRIVPVEQFLGVAEDIVDYTGSSGTESQVLTTTLQAVDYVVGGTYRSPQFYPRDNAIGERLPLYEQVWNLKKPPRSEDVPFWLFVPKGRTGPAPLAIFVHGHGSTKFDALLFAGIFASYGIATLGIDAPGHGVDLAPLEIELIVNSFFVPRGLGGLGDSIIRGRALDWTGDGEVNSGDDYWVAYVIHTRDVVRQTMVDAMQLVRILRSFDGVNRWGYDMAGTGSNGIAGDFDGDGEVDVGGEAPIHAIGGSLGGITSAVLAGVEPAIGTVVSIIPGGMLSEIGTRSNLGGVKNAMMLRALGPIIYADTAARTINMRANLGNTSSVSLELADLPRLTPQDTVVLTNKKTGEWRCGAVQPSGTFRVAVSSDAGDPLVLRIYHGPLPPREREGCEPEGEAPYYQLAAFQREVRYAGKTFDALSPLVAPTDGFGLRRGTPDLRRFLGLAQIALDPADPMNWAPYWDGTRTMTYGTGETTNSNVLVIPSIGDPGVPVAGGVAIARAAGLVPYDTDDPRYGKSDNQVLIDTYAVEGTYRLGRHTNSVGAPVLMDVEHLSSVIPADDGFDVPRLDPPLRLVSLDEQSGVYRGFILPMLQPTGKHGFPTPDPTKSFDLGTYMLNMVSRYIASDAQEFTWDRCQAFSDCAWETFPLPTP